MTTRADLSEHAISPDGIGCPLRDSGGACYAKPYGKLPDYLTCHGNQPECRHLRQQAERIRELEAELEEAKADGLPEGLATVTCECCGGKGRCIVQTPASEFARVEETCGICGGTGWMVTFDEPAARAAAGEVRDE